jgi:2-keto-4-pentenoate hydratase/2-oxohepta-3-ene-1,7-dioic acid hydratase in catechol pathway
VVAQAVNYRGHAQESGFGESPPAVFFRKSSASVSGPTDDVVRPRHVRLLDESKSYPTFTPTGPRLALLDPKDFPRLAGLRLRLWVNGELRQDGTAADMITRPAATLTLLARFQPLDPGDLLLTGTPGGTALQAPPAVIEKMGDLLPTPLKWRVFFSRQERNPAYLKAGDQITASITVADGTLDLGTQRVAIRDAP